ncbi:hypothetical protein [Aquihabitans sp. McL0605]|uniref:hypothetical protein n=1 Tax=Aquihabitans sp. McL0605 TaxID=3415671 RepID=UPI003CEBFD3A
MFIQIIKGRVTDEDRFRVQADRWPQELKPGAVGYLGCTWGIAPDGTAIIAARFESDVDAKTNSERPEQGEWWAGMEPLLADPAFSDCSEVDTLMAGGSDDAGFVQVIQGRVKDQQQARTMLQSMQGELAQRRPDILGGWFGWHGLDGEFTQLVYFRSEEAARAGESGNDEEMDNRYQEMMAGEPTFIDLPDPHFD